MNAILQEGMTKKQIKQDNHYNAKVRLDEILNQEQEIFCIIRHVSQSGMTRHISFFLYCGQSTEVFKWLYFGLFRL